MELKRSDDPFPDYFYKTENLNTKIELINYRDNLFWGLNLNENVVEGITGDPNIYLPPYEDNEEGLIDCTEIDDDYDVRPSNNDTFTISFYVPKALQSSIIGLKGRKIKELQEKTNTLIKVPRINEIGDVKIEGGTERDVVSCKNQIQMVLFNRREKMPVTHFLSIPIISDEVKNNFNKFKDNILKGTPYRGVDETIFQNENKLHLTLAVLRLLDDKEIEEAKKLINYCYSNFLLEKFPKNKKNYIKIEGLEIMNDDPTEVDVLFGKVEFEDDRTNQFKNVCQQITDYLSKKNLIKRNYDGNINLHVTLMNTTYRLRKNNDQKRITFDASYILDKHKNYYFGRIIFNNIQLSVRHQYDQNGYYESLLTLTL